MKTKKLLPLLFLTCTKLAFGQITFQKIFAEQAPCQHCESYSIPYDIKETYDNGYILTGLVGDSIYQFAYPYVYPFLMKLDNNGDTVWIKYSVTGSTVLQACDSGYITSGPSISKSDSSGNVLWSKQYPSIGAGKYVATIRTNDCGYILASATDSFGAGGYDMYVIKTDTGGNPLWSKTYGGTGDDEISDIKQTVDGGFIIAGFTDSFDTTGYQNGYLVKTDSNGDTLWTKKYSSFDGFSVQQTYDRGYILGGAYLIKTDSLGNVMWSNTLSGGPIYQTPDSGYIFLSRATSSGGFDLLLIRTNSAGNLVWVRDFPGPPEGYRNGVELLQTTDGGYMISDYTQITALQFPQEYIDLDKTDANGQSGCNETNTTVAVSSVSITASGTATVVSSPTTTVTASSVTSGYASMDITTECSTGIPESRIQNATKVFPNPVQPDGSINILLDEDINGAEITIFNMIGQPLFSEVATGNGEKLVLSLRGRLRTGMYLLRLVKGGKTEVKKIVVMD